MNTSVHISEIDLPPHAICFAKAICQMLDGNMPDESLIEGSAELRGDLRTTVSLFNKFGSASVRSRMQGWRQSGSRHATYVDCYLASKLSIETPEEANIQHQESPATPAKGEDLLENETSSNVTKSRGEEEASIPCGCPHPIEAVKPASRQVPVVEPRGSNGATEPFDHAVVAEAAEGISHEDFERTSLLALAEDRPPHRRIGTIVADAERERIAWLWPGWLAHGKISILDGDPGVGKSTLYCDLIARHTRGRPWPDESEITPYREPGNAIIVTVEDGIGDTIRPRLEEAGANIERVTVISTIPKYNHLRKEWYETIPTLPDDLTTIEEAIIESGATLLVIDPLTAHLSGKTNSWKDEDVRRALAPLSVLAEKHNVAILVIRHFTKAEDRSALHRGSGSIGIIGIARLAMMLGKSPAGDDTLVLASTKTNLAKMPDSLSLAIVSSPRDPDTGVVEWHGASPYSADAVLTRRWKPRAGKLEEAIDWLKAKLADGKSPQSAIIEEAAAAGIAEKTLRRAKKELRVESVKEGKDGGWWWRLPNCEDGQGTTEIVKVATSNGHVGAEGGHQPSLMDN